MGTAQTFNFVQIAAIAAILIVALLFAWWYAQRPSHMREWQPDVARLATAEIQGHHVTVKNVRNFRYRSTIDFDERWEERHFDLTMLDGLDIFFIHWGSPLIADEAGAPEDDFRTYRPTSWPGARLPHVWLDGHVALQDHLGPGYALLRLGAAPKGTAGLEEAMKRRGAPFQVLDIPDAAARDLYGVDLVLLRPDLHVAWRGNRTPAEPAKLAARVTGHLEERRSGGKKV